MKIRNYTPRDYESVKALLKHCGLFDESYDKKEKFDNKKPSGSIIVAEEDSRIIGFVLFTYDCWDSSIYRLAVHSDFRNKGVATILLTEAEKRLKDFGADVVQLGFKSDEKNKKKFFEKMGYSGEWGPYTWTEKKLK